MEDHIPMNYVVVHDYIPDAIVPQALSGHPLFDLSERGKRGESKRSEITMSYELFPIIRE
jgi:hypothetical protein